MNLEKLSENVIAGSIKEHVEHLNNLFRECARRGFDVTVDCDTFEILYVGHSGKQARLHMTAIVSKQIGKKS